ncbi:sensor domain-containing diguanylate cyclase [Egibacter rhizosphaerae]|uniref:Sensor domain-containing diguanylate cyclase n=1 Tax=Egibacter rhizosphaerae TaxID=1670831 RepID=A0A411YJE3_9ACTN|nr:sensor domain-containing diguanylate cyclase [Egibacter rhizosphaerae]QBI21212.1 sensor domain-containing diguanylate cyclase [Egibacter rhizosphaerae]
MLAAVFVAISLVPVVLGVTLLGQRLDQQVAERAQAELVTAADAIVVATDARATRVGDLTSDAAELLVAEEGAEALADADEQALGELIDDLADGRVPERADVLVVVAPDGRPLATAGSLPDTTDEELAEAVVAGEQVPGVSHASREVQTREDDELETLGWVAAANPVTATELTTGTTVDFGLVRNDSVVAATATPPASLPPLGEVEETSANGTAVTATTATSTEGTLVIWSQRPTTGGLLAPLTAVAAPVALLALVLAWLLAGQLTRPLATAAAAARDVADGDLERRAPDDRGPAEVRELSAALNQMATQLSQRLTEVQESRDALAASLDRVGQSLAARLDLSHVLDVIASSAEEALAADRAEVLLVEDGELRPYTHGFTPDVDLAGPLRRLAEHVYATGRPSRLPDPQDEIHSDASDGAALCVPLRRHGGVRGTLTVWRLDASQPYDDRDVAILRSFSSHASVALDHVDRHAEAQRQAATDGLTGLANIRTLRDTLSRECSAADRHGRELSVLTVDLDHFKHVNDVWGHDAGDTVLVEVARRLSDSCRTSDLVARAGGEEFIVLLPETDTAGAQVIGERVRQSVSATPVRVRGGNNDPDGQLELSVTCSVGIATRDPQEPSDDLLRRADQALYDAKRRGRDRVITATPPPVGEGTGERPTTGPDA